MKMNGNAKFAIAWALMALIYSAIAGLNFWTHRPILGIVLLFVGWLLGAWQIFWYGARYGVDEAYDDVTEMVERLESLRRIMEARLNSIRNSLGGANEEEAGKTDSCDRRQTCCDYCGCDRFTVAAGRLVCACCGEVMGKVHGEDQVR